MNALPMVVEAGGDPADYPAITQWSADWPAILTDFNPMVATMSDNVDNYQAVDALPSFDLFPWFFVIPGVLVAGLAGLALRTRTEQIAAPPAPASAEQSSTPTSPSTV